jgi:hypothetical protein
MVKNINDPERVVRFVAGAAIASMAFWGPKNLWLLLGLVPMATGFIGSCPLYSMLGISTYHGKKEH